MGVKKTHSPSKMCLAQLTIMHCPKCHFGEQSYVKILNIGCEYGENYLKKLADLSFALFYSVYYDKKNYICILNNRKDKYNSNKIWD